MAAIRYTVPVKYQELSSTSDGSGGTKDGTWTDVFSFMASVEPLTGFRKFEHAQIVRGNAYTVRTHYRTDFTNKGRLKLYDDTIMNIRSLVNQDYKNRQIEIIADDGR